MIIHSRGSIFHNVNQPTSSPRPEQGGMHESDTPVIEAQFAGCASTNQCQHSVDRPDIFPLCHAIELQ
jgi:hypothetical protein